MSSFNKVILMGHLTRDWEQRFTPKGTAVAKTDIAVNRTWQTDSGEKREDVAFVPLESWGRTAEALVQYTVKGDPLLVEGRVAQENWEDKTTHQKRSRLKVVIETFAFVKAKGGNDGAPARPASRPAAAPAPGGNGVDEPPPPEEYDVPF